MFQLIHFSLLLLASIHFAQLLIQIVLGLSFLIEFSQFFSHLLFFGFAEKVSLSKKSGFSLLNRLNLLFFDDFFILGCFVPQYFLHSSGVSRLWFFLGFESKFVQLSVSFSEIVLVDVEVAASLSYRWKSHHHWLRDLRKWLLLRCHLFCWFFLHHLLHLLDLLCFFFLLRQLLHSQLHLLQLLLSSDQLCFLLFESHLLRLPLWLSACLDQLLLLLFDFFNSLVLFLLTKLDYFAYHLFLLIDKALLLHLQLLTLFNSFADHFFFFLTL